MSERTALIADPPARTDVADLRASLLAAGYTVRVFVDKQPGKPSRLRVALAMPGAAEDKAMIKREFETEIPAGAENADIAPLVRDFLKNAASGLGQVK